MNSVLIVYLVCQPVECMKADVRWLKKQQHRNNDKLQLQSDAIRAPIQSAGNASPSPRWSGGFVRAERAIMIVLKHIMLLLLLMSSLYNLFVPRMQLAIPNFVSIPFFVSSRSRVVSAIPTARSSHEWSPWFDWCDIIISHLTIRCSAPATQMTCPQCICTHCVRRAVTLRRPRFDHDTPYRFDYSTYASLCVIDEKAVDYCDFCRKIF